MNNFRFPYSEDILQWIWNALLFKTNGLTTQRGEPLSILDKGELNLTDGPDFLNASVRIGKIVWNGAIELHLNSKGWYQHGHHEDPKYNNVVLHVVVEDNPVDVQRQGGGSPETLNLLPFLNGELRSFIPRVYQSSKLPCISGLSFISKEAFKQQVEKAHLEYLEKKVNDFLHFYNPELLPSQAWKNALILSVFDGLGISYNRAQMVKVGEWFINQEPKREEELIAGALSYAGFYDGESEIHWNYKAVRPHNHPRKRVEQGIRLGLIIQGTDFGDFLNSRGKALWKAWVAKAKIANTVREEILYGTVYLPALYALGSLFGANSLSKSVFEEWRNLSSPVPEQLLKKFYSIPGIDHKTVGSKLGAVHQLKAYCNSRRCHECLVLKKVI